MEYDIIKVTADMIPQIAEIEEIEFSYPMTADMLKRLLEDDTSIFIAAVSGDNVLGYASLKFVEDEGLFNNIAVSRDFRGLGIGGFLLKELLQRSKEYGINTVSLEVRESNLTAIGLYKKNGFITVGNIKNYYTKPQDNAIIMRTSF